MRDIKRRRKSNFDSLLRKADQQWGIHMRDKCGNMQTACEAMSYLRRPTKSKLKKQQARASAIFQARQMAPNLNTPMDITKAIDES